MPEQIPERSELGVALAELTHDVQQRVRPRPGAEIRLRGERIRRRRRAGVVFASALAVVGVIALVGWPGLGVDRSAPPARSVETRTVPLRAAFPTAVERGVPRLVQGRLFRPLGVTPDGAVFGAYYDGASIDGVPRESGLVLDPADPARTAVHDDGPDRTTTLLAADEAVVLGIDSAWSAKAGLNNEPLAPPWRLWCTDRATGSTTVLARGSARPGLTQVAVFGRTVRWQYQGDPAHRMVTGCGRTVRSVAGPLPERITLLSPALAVAAGVNDPQGTGAEAQRLSGVRALDLGGGLVRRLSAVTGPDVRPGAEPVALAANGAGLAWSVGWHSPRLFYAAWHGQPVSAGTRPLTPLAATDQLLLAAQLVDDPANSDGDGAGWPVFGLDPEQHRLVDLGLAALPAGQFTSGSGQFTPGGGSQIAGSGRFILLPRVDDGSASSRWSAHLINLGSPAAAPAQVGFDDLRIGD